MSENKFYTVSDVCKILNRHYNTIYRYIKTNVLKATQPVPNGEYLINAKDLEEFLQSHTNIQLK